MKSHIFLIGHACDGIPFAPVGNTVSRHLPSYGLRASTHLSHARRPRFHARRRPTHFVLFRSLFRRFRCLCLFIFLTRFSLTRCRVKHHQKVPRLRTPPSAHFPRPTSSRAWLHRSRVPNSLRLLPRPTLRRQHRRTERRERLPTRVARSSAAVRPRSARAGNGGGMVRGDDARDAIGATRRYRRGWALKEHGDRRGARGRLAKPSASASRVGGLHVARDTLARSRERPGELDGDDEGCVGVRVRATHERGRQPLRGFPRVTGQHSMASGRETGVREDLWGPSGIS